MNFRLTLFLLISFISNGHANNISSFQPWNINAAIGLAFYPQNSVSENQNALARLGFGYNFIAYNYLALGIETNIQNGAFIRTNFSADKIDALGGVPIEIEMKPILDLLVSFKYSPLKTFPLITMLKGGIAYRQIDLHRIEINNLGKVSPEFQLGFGYRLNELASINFSYQTILGHNLQLSVNPIDDTGKINSIFSQNAVTVGFCFEFV